MADLLSGIRVVDFTQYLAGPTVTRLMAELGADVVKVELAPGGDPARLMPIQVEGRSGFYVQQNRGKRSLCVDWDDPRGIEVVRRLLARADVVVENFGPGVMEKRGITYDAVRADNPAVIMASISAFGRTGSYANRVGYDMIAQAFSGMMHMTGDPDGPPAAAGFAIADSTAAVHGFAALGYALLHRERTGEGQHIDIAMVDAMFHLSEVLSQYDLSGGSYRPNRIGQHHPLVCPVGVYRVPEGGALLMCLDRQWPYLTKAMGRPDLATDPRFNPSTVRAENQAELIPQIQEWLLTFPDNDAVFEACRVARIPIAPVMDPVETITHPQYVARDMVRRVPDPVVGDVLIAGFPFKFSAQPELPDIVAPLLGEHNAELLGELLDIDAAEVAALEARGVLHRSDR